MSWIWPNFLHHDLPLTTGQRKAINRAAWKLWWANKWNLAVYLLLPAVYVLTVFFASDVAGRIGTSVGASGLIHRLFRAAGPIVLFVLCFVVGGAILRRYRFAPCVYRAARGHGYDVCPRCGYWLQGLGDEIEYCPECGASREAPPPADSS